MVAGGEVLRSSPVLCGPGGEELAAVGITVLELPQLGIQQKFVIVRGLSFDLIPGMDLLQKEAANIDVRRRKATISDLTLRLARRKIKQGQINPVSSQYKKLSHWCSQGMSHF